MSDSEDMALELIVPAEIEGISQNDFDISSLVWYQKDRTPIRLGDMADSHLRNTALMLMGLGYQNYKAPDYIKVKWLTALRLEWERRMRERNGSKNFATSTR